MKQRKLFFGLLFAIIAPVTLAQKIILKSKAKITDINPKPLEIGYQMPEIIFKNTLNFPQGVKKASDLKGKLIIFDFWNTQCASCIASFPHMEDLQAKFKQDVVIIAVNCDEDVTQANKNIKKLNSVGVKRNQLGTITSLPIWFDKSMMKIFPHREEPYHVWIDKNGKVISMTAGWNATEEHITQSLKGESVKMAVFQDLLSKYNYKMKPLLVPAVNDIPWPLFYSAFLPYKNGMGGANYKVDDSIHHTFRIAFNSLPILQLYTLAYPDEYKNKLFLKVKDTSEYVTPKMSAITDDWLQRNCFTYELTIPLKDKARYKEYMIADLNRFFGSLRNICGIIETEEVPCWVLTLNNKKLLESRKDTTKNNTGSYKKIDSLFVYTGGKVNNIISFIQHNMWKDLNKPFIVVNETGLDNQIIDFSITNNFSDLNQVKNTLLKSGFELTFSKRPVKILSIKDIPLATN